MDNVVLVMILVSAIITFLLRAFPFLFFHGNRKMPDWLERLGKILPSAIMAVLIIYCLKDIGSDWLGVGIPRIIAVAVVTGSYKWRHNTLLSVIGGTAVYMILLQVF